MRFKRASEGAKASLSAARLVTSLFRPTTIALSSIFVQQEPLMGKGNKVRKREVKKPKQDKKTIKK
jgi:hypothetical protein